MNDRLASALADRYRIEREVGQGGMATVYLAQDLRHEREVAIKVLHPDLGAALGGDRFLSEIKTTARLQHPHILPLLDSGEADGLLYYVMPYVRGETLRTRLERERQLPIEDAGGSRGKWPTRWGRRSGGRSSCAAGRGETREADSAGGEWVERYDEPLGPGPAGDDDEPVTGRTHVVIGVIGGGVGRPEERGPR
jgi:hypothetical protein